MYWYCRVCYSIGNFKSDCTLILKIDMCNFMTVFNVTLSYTNIGSYLVQRTVFREWMEKMAYR